MLLGVAVEYLELQAAGALLEARRRTEAEAAEVARITAVYARTGEGRQADANRAETQHQLRKAEVRRAEERLAVASARLARRLHLDPSTRIEPASQPIEAFSLIDLDTRAEDLIQVAQQGRPEILARSAGIRVAETRTRQEKTRPFLPTVWLGFSGGAFGGGSNLTPPLVGEFRGRTDFDAIAYWSLLNFGAGNLANVKRRNAQLGVAVADRDRAINQVREEVTSARAEALAKRDQIGIAIDQLAISQDGYQKDLERIRGAAGPPLEVLNNLQLLNKAREALVESVLGYNQAQFQLFVAMGSPPPLDLPTQPAAPPAAVEALASQPSTSGASSVGAITETSNPSKDQSSETTLRASLESLELAKRAMVQAKEDYEKIQGELLKTVNTTEKPPGREDLTRGLAALAEAHRNELTASIAYDKVLWQIMAGSKPLDQADPQTQKTSTR